MLLHGFGENHHIWDSQTAILKDHFRVILPDIPGSGQSEMLEGVVTVEHYAQVIRDILDAEGIGSGQPFCLVGHSMGGYIALAYAEKFPETLSGLGLFHSSAYPDDEEKISVRKKGIDFIEKNGSASFLKASVPNLFAETTLERRPGLVEQLLDLSKDISSEALIQYYHAMILRPDRTILFESFAKPVMFMIGKFDKSVPLQNSLKQCHIPPVSYVQILEHSGHMGMWEEQEKSSQFLLDFFNDL